MDVKTREWHSVHAVHDGLYNSAGGRLINMREPVADMFCIEDIAMGLSNICRFGGQIGFDYKVAQHCVLVCALAPEELKYEALMHDASEAYLGDVIKPLKVMLEPLYGDIEGRFMRVIGDVFGLDGDKLRAIKEYDRRALEIEHNHFRGVNSDGWFKVWAEMGYYYNTVMTNDFARGVFMNRYNKHRRL